MKYPPVYYLFILFYVFFLRDHSFANFFHRSPGFVSWNYPLSPPDINNSVLLPLLLLVFHVFKAIICKHPLEKCFCRLSDSLVYIVSNLYMDLFEAGNHNALYKVFLRKEEDRDAREYSQYRPHHQHVPWCHPPHGCHACQEYGQRELIL